MLSNIRSGIDVPIDEGDRAFYHGRLRNRIFNLILNKFVEEQKATGLTKAVLARRIGRAPAVITRYLSAPSNLTLETISDLLLGIGGEELDPVSSAVDGQARTYNASKPTASGNVSIASAPPPAQTPAANSNMADSSSQQQYIRFNAKLYAQEYSLRGNEHGQGLRPMSLTENGVQGLPASSALGGFHP